MRQTSPPKRTFQKSSASYGQLSTLLRGTGTTGSLRSSYPPPVGRCKRTTLKVDSFQYQVRYSTQRLRTAPKKRAILKLSASYRQLSTLLMGTGTTGSLRSSYHTARRAVQKDNLKSRLVSISSSILHSGAANDPPKKYSSKVECFI